MFFRTCERGGPQLCYPPDAQLVIMMNAPAAEVKQRGSYNLAGVSFTPEQIAASIRRRIPGFTMDCVPDFRQAIAASWPQRIDDSTAQADWGWKLQYDLDAMVDDMLENLRKQLKS